MGENDNDNEAGTGGSSSGIIKIIKMILDGDVPVGDWNPNPPSDDS